MDDVVGVSSTTSQPSGSGDGGVADVGRSTDGLVSNGLAFDGPTSDGPTSDKLAAKKLASAKLVIARAQLLALLRAIREQSPLSSSSPHHQQQAANSNSKNSNKTPLIIGAVHSRTLSLLTSVTQSCSSPWLTFLYRVGGWSTNRKTANSNNNNEELLSSLDLVWGTVVESEFAMVRSRTAIPRSDATLALLPCVGVRKQKEGRLVGWAFLGVDGSVASLHVEPEFRGRGVGRAVAARVLAGLWDGEGFGGMEIERGMGSVLGYSHAAVENGGSIAIAKALGGWLGWRAYWVTVDLEAC